MAHPWIPTEHRTRQHRRVPMWMLLILLLPAVFTGCDSGDDDPGESDLAGSFRVDGTLYTTDGLPAGARLQAMRQDIPVGSRTVTILSGGLSTLSENTVHAVWFAVTGIDATGTYTVDPDVDAAESAEPGGAAAYVVCDVSDVDDPQECDEDSGQAVSYSSLSDWTLTITAITDDRLAGSFEFVGEQEDGDDTVTVEGEFDLPLIAP